MTEYRDDITYLAGLHRSCGVADACRRTRRASAALHRTRAPLPDGHGRPPPRLGVPQRIIESRRVALTARIAYPIIRPQTEQLIGWRAFAHLAAFMQQNEPETPSETGTEGRDPDGRGKRHRRGGRATLSGRGRALRAGGPDAGQRLARAADRSASGPRGGGHRGRHAA
ncbi:Exonuclease SbcC [Burkholderia vietnamiensis]|nr:Exonuclease SbcC [Burkholderia vietnamiensis]